MWGTPSSRSSSKDCPRFPVRSREVANDMSSQLHAVFKSSTPFVGKVNRSTGSIASVCRGITTSQQQLDESGTCPSREKTSSKFMASHPGAKFTETGQLRLGCLCGGSSLFSRSDYKRLPVQLRIHVGKSIRYSNGQRPPVTHRSVRDASYSRGTRIICLRATAQRMYQVSTSLWF